MGIFRIFDIASSGMYAQRVRMNVIASNIANANTTRTAEGGPYKKKDVVFVPESNIYYNMGIPTGVRVGAIVESKRPFRVVYDPYHPDADKDGYVKYPNVEVVEEMVNMMSSVRSYEANVTVFNGAKDIA
ncbi:MAG: flagellar basal body rod protein FlgC, partial [Thermosulfidibacteraceae bacterium]